MPLSVQRALQLGQFVYAAENPATARPVSYTVPFGFQLVQTIYGNDLATDIGGTKDIVPFGFIARSPAPANDFVVAIRGTASIWEWIQDARFLRVTCPCGRGAGESEDGFTDVYRSLVIASTGATPRLVDGLHSLLSAAANATLAITGHSLGAALATLLAFEVTESGVFATPEVITFASPLVGDAQFAHTVNTEVPNMWRIVNDLDLVPKMPPSIWGYDHVEQKTSVNSFHKVKMEPACCHHLTTYLYLLNLLNPAGTFSLDTNCKCGL